MLTFKELSKKITKRAVIGLVLEFGPVFLFLTTYEIFHVYKATLALMMATIVSTIITFRLQKRLPYFALYIALLTLLFGYLTLAHHNPKFIQIRDTMYDVICALTLMVGLMTNTHFLKLAFNSIFPMATSAWTKVTYFWIAFFLIVATLNEYIRRTMSIADWFHFKSISVLVTVIFGLVVMYLCYKKEGE